MPDYTGGYTSAVNDQSRREYADAEVKRLLFALSEAQQKAQEQQQARQRAQHTFQLPPTFDAPGPPPVQPSGPGQPSVPMQPPQPPPMTGPSPFGPPGGQINPMLLQAMQRPQVPMMTGGAQGAPQGAPPPMGGGMGAPAPAAPPVAPPAAPDRWKNMADSASPPGAAPDPPIIPRKLIDPMEQVNLARAHGVEGQELYDWFTQNKPMWDASNKAKMDEAELAVRKAQARAESDLAVEREWKLEQEKAGGGAGKKLPAEMANTIFAAGGDPTKGLDQQPPGVIERARKIAAAQETKKGSTTINIGGGGMLTDEGKRLAAEQYRKTGQLPPMYRDAKGRAEIINLAAQIEKEEGGDVADVPGRRAAFKADAASLTQRQRFVDAGNQFIKNMQSQADLVDKYMTKGAAGGVPVFNKWIQAGRKQLAGDADVTALDTAIRGLAREHQRIVTGVTSNAQLHVSAQETADQLLNVAQTPAQMRAAIKVMREEAQNAVEAGKQEVADIRARMKGSGEAASPTPSGLREFKNLEDAKKAGMKAGMRVKIGGVEGSLKDE